MVTMYPRLEVYGKNLNGRDLEKETELSFRSGSENNPGDIGGFGKYLGKPRPYGSATLEPPVSHEGMEGVNWLLQTYEMNRLAFERNGATDVVLWLVVGYIDQCNLEFEPALLRKIGDLAISFCISCYDDTERSQ